ncbi:diguanylate cyclase [Pseudomonas monteilii]|uniref:Diguanylate cyclase n=1 Tax=Pseudomonas monteilii TaxID=76759 RepID=A0A399M216_9PSED|nr:diguanylate cyclase [Pseudomonas monteilii]
MRCRIIAESSLNADPVGAGLPANTGNAGAIHRGACFAGKPAPTGI